MPNPGKRHFSLTIPGRPTGGPDGQNRLVYNDDLFSGEIGQVGTQLDGLGHRPRAVGVDHDRQAGAGDVARGARALGGSGDVFLGLERGTIRFVGG